MASSRMGIVGIHPAVFVRVANKGVTGYGTWKSVRRMGRSRSERPNVGRLEEREGISLEGCTPLFLVSVASKGVRPAVSLLFATLAGRCISVAAKGLRGEGRLKIESPD